MSHIERTQGKAEGRERSSSREHFLSTLENMGKGRPRNPPLQHLLTWAHTRSKPHCCWQSPHPSWLTGSKKPSVPSPLAGAEAGLKGMLDTRGLGSPRVQRLRSWRRDFLLLLQRACSASRAHQSHDRVTPGRWHCSYRQPRGQGAGSSALQAWHCIASAAPTLLPVGCASGSLH